MCSLPASIRPERKRTPLRGRRRSAFAVIASLLAACASRSASPDFLPLPASADTGVVVLSQPTLIGYHPRPTRAGAGDSAVVRGLAEFQSGLARVRGSFEQAGVAVHEQYTDTLVVRDPSRGLQIYVPPSGHPIGYYLAAPGREPDILHGLRSETELQDAAWGYFHGGETRRASR